ncbi:MAG TPA: universal stress protein [Terriglobales bacterium]|nr:universal stress protein [Terriglobales bacterium]
MYGRILVPLDGSPAAEQVLPLARLFARGLSATIDLISVIDLVELAHHVSAADNLFLDSLAEDEARHRRKYLGDVAKGFSGGTVHCRVETGKAESVIIEAAATEAATLIAMATHGRSGLNRWLLGSVTEKVLRGSSHPLLLVRAAAGAPSAKAALQSIVVPLDGSPLAETVLPAVVDLAKKLDLAVILFRVYHIPYGVYDVSGSYGFDFERLLSGIEGTVQQYLEEKRAALQVAGLEKVTIASKQGISADEIIEFSRKVPDSLIAMNSHGRSGVKRWVLGSVAETVVRHAANPMLIFRATL